jgi:ERCC4-type nuclease
MKLVLDERETSLYEKCIALPRSPSIILEKKVLPLGDAILKMDDDTEIVIIERKSLQDLLASIKDGRYVEQSYRLQNCCSQNPHKVMYIIEGVFAQLRNPAQEKTVVFSSMTSLNIFKGFSVIRTSCLQETAEWIMAMADKVERSLNKGHMPYCPTGVKGHMPYCPTGVKGHAPYCPSDQEHAPENKAVIYDNPPATQEKYCEVVKKVKKENLTPENMGEVILCQIPSVSSVSAIAVMKEHKNIATLIHALEKNPGCLDKIVCEGGNGKSRKISKTVVKNIKDYLLNRPENPT